MKTMKPEYTYTDPEGMRWTLTRVKRNNLPGFVTGVRIEDGRTVTLSITGAHTVRPWTSDVQPPSTPEPEGVEILPGNSDTLTPNDAR